MLNEALYLTPDQPSQLRSVALSKLACGEPDRAEAALRAALAIDLAVVLQTQGRHAEAEPCCREALAACPGHAVAYLRSPAGLARHVEAAYRAWYDAC